MIPVILGFFTRFFLIPPIINMAVAAFIFHSADPFAVKEKAIMYLIVFVALFFTGPGKFSLQAVLKKDWFKNPVLKFIFR
jgi:putative oxidoreductase